MNWKTENHREMIALGNRFKLGIYTHETRGWIATIVAHAQHFDGTESEKSIGTRTLDLHDPNDEETARHAAIRWARDWLGDMVTPLQISREAVEDPEVTVEAPAEIGDLGRWMMSGHEESITSGNMRLQLFLRQTYGRNDGRPDGHCWQAELFLANSRCFGMQVVAAKTFSYGSLQEARSTALAWAREETAKIAKAFAEPST